MFKKSPDLLFNVVFNFPQTAVMILVISAYQGIRDPKAIFQSYVFAYFVGFLFTALLNLPGAGAAMVRLFRCEKNKVASYFVANITAGLIMGVCVTFFMTFFAVGLSPSFPQAFLATIFIALPARAFSSCIWFAPVMAIVHRVYPE